MVSGHCRKPTDQTTKLAALEQQLTKAQKSAKETQDKSENVLQNGAKVLAKAPESSEGIVVPDSLDIEE